MQRKFTNNLHPDKTLMFNISGFKLRAVSIESRGMPENLTSRQMVSVGTSDILRSVSRLFGCCFGSGGCIFGGFCGCRSCFFA